MDPPPTHGIAIPAAEVGSKAQSVSGAYKSGQTASDTHRKEARHTAGGSGAREDQRPQPGQNQYNAYSQDQGGKHTADIYKNTCQLARQRRWRTVDWHFSFWKRGFVMSEGNVMELVGLWISKRPTQTPHSQLKAEKRWIEIMKTFYLYRAHSLKKKEIERQHFSTKQCHFPHVGEYTEQHQWHKSGAADIYSECLQSRF